MIIFFDTSALIKLFHTEPGSALVTDLITSPNNDIWISELARIEFYSALYRRYRNKEIDGARLEAAVLGFEEQCLLFNIEPLGQVVVQEAETLMKRFGKTMGLRTLDSLQLGSFVLIGGQDWYFTAADETLCRIAEETGAKTINPLSDKLPNTPPNSNLS
ncbi:MAG: type II toxin-antitoxin system VapC family toxin [Pseudomonadota bacterium]